MYQEKNALPKSFFKRDTQIVAKELLGKQILHRTNEGRTLGKIVETEAYFGPDDPASRASNGKTKVSKTMWSNAATILVYVVHGYFLFNIVTEEAGIPGAVLIRAVEPLRGINLMNSRREREDIHELCSGPGKFTQAFGITKAYNNCNIVECDDLVLSYGREEEFEVETTHRIGVTEDLPEELRFCIQGSPFLSR